MANVGNSIRVKFEEINSLAFGAIGAAFAPIGDAFDNPIRILKIVNTTNADVVISFDGVTEQDFVPANGFTLYDFCANQAQPAGAALMDKGTQVYALTDGAPTTGSVIVVAIYVAGAVY